MSLAELLFCLTPSCKDYILKKFKCTHLFACLKNYFVTFKIPMTIMIIVIVIHQLRSFCDSFDISATFCKGPEMIAELRPRFVIVIGGLVVIISAIVLIVT